jgi:magnesium transporter
MKRKAPARRKKRFRRPGMEGIPPGSIVIDPTAPKPDIHLMAFSPQEYAESSITEVKEILPYLEKWPVTWVNVTGLGDETIIRQLGELFRHHHLALEDVVNLYQRAKVELYGDHIFITTRMISRQIAFDTEQISMFLGKNFVITFQQKPGDCLDPIRNRIRKKLGRVRDAGTDYLAYALLDAIVDDYFPTLEEFGERMDKLEDEILDHPAPDILPRVREVKRDLMTIRRAIWPQREAINTLLRDPLPHISDETRIYFRDCYDHVIRLMDITENYRELSSDLMDVHLSSLSNRMNEVMKTLTVIASIFIPLTFIVGIYGMNFDIESSPLNMPELYTYWGYPGVMLFMLILSLGMLYYFRRKGWMGSGRSSD